MISAHPHLTSLPYRPDIDGLRAIAVMSVVIFHAFPSWMPGGFIGVDVFFVVSGFLISSIIFENLQNGTFGFTQFYARRIRRIFPALLVVLGAILVFGWFALLADEYSTLVKHIAAGAGFVSNFVLWNEVSYFDHAAETKPLLHLWSLAIEEQFYILWPLLLWGAWKLKINFLALATALAVLSFVLNMSGVQQDLTAAFYSPQTRFWELLCGSMLACLRRHRTLAASASIISALGGSLLTYGFWSFSSATRFPGTWAVVPVAGAALVILAGPNAWINRVILSNKAVVWIGLISFPIYLWHWPVLAFANIIESADPGAAIKACAIALSIALAWLTCKLVERPLRYGEYGRFKTVGLSLSMAVVAAVAFIAWNQRILPPTAEKWLAQSDQIGWELPVASEEQRAACNQRFPQRGEIVKTLPSDNFCVAQNAKEPEVLLIGDSLNLSLYPGLSQYDDLNVMVLAASSAVPFYNVLTAEEGDTARAKNYQLTNQALDYAVSNDNIRVVVLAAIRVTGIAAQAPGFKITDVTNASDNDAQRVFVRAMRDTLQRLQAAGKRVVYVMPNPRLSYEIKSCLGGARPFTLTDNGTTCTRPLNDAFDDTMAYRAWVNEVLQQFPEVVVFDAFAPFCDEKQCYGALNGQVLYRDRAHLSVNGSRLVAPHLHELLVKMLRS